MALTLADQWDRQTVGTSVIIGHGGAIRATAGLVGRGACLISGKKIFAAVSRRSDRQLNTRFDPEGKVDAANNQLHLDTARLRTLGFSLRDVAAFLAGLDVFEAAFTADEVRAAQARLPKQ